YGKDVPLAVDDNLQGAFGIQVYPNPASEVLNIKLNNAQKATFKIFDLAGQLVKESSSSDQLAEINISGLPKGVYILNINTGKESVNKKIIKK
ncbi:MAG: T9SS type A sorting domain-containing protein, partial [Weeksellaceae bacterium]|nr:T9SS type A sorting domain-containing protein [Weeksellaceae bacterium]